MAGEILRSTNLKDAKEELRNIYKEKSNEFSEISKEDYEKLEPSEREDSDNHLNEEKLAKEADVIDLAYYKYLPDRKVAYRIILKHKDGEEMHDYFAVIPDMA
ncbi:MAG: hypothetical protein O3B47_00545 [bacterium]|nr:hypothetical protein [bacterium]